MSQVTPGLDSTIKSYIDRREKNIQTTLIGKIVSYDHSTQTAVVKPEQAEVWRDGKGERLVQDFPKLYEVPVAFPRGGGFSITWPLDDGDPVHIICTKYAFDRWQSEGKSGDQGDLRRFGLSGAIAYPINLYKGSDAIPNTETNAIVLSAGGTTDWVALSDKVYDELVKIKNVLEQHTHPNNGLPANSTSAAATTLYSPSKPKASKVRAE